MFYGEFDGFLIKSSGGGGGDEGHTDGDLEDPQLLCFWRSQIVKRFRISFADIHIQIMVGDDIDAVTGDVGSA